MPGGTKLDRVSDADLEADLVVLAQGAAYMRFFVFCRACLPECAAWVWMRGCQDGQGEESVGGKCGWEVWVGSVGAF